MRHQRQRSGQLDKVTINSLFTDNPPPPATGGASAPIPVAHPQNTNKIMTQYAGYTNPIYDSGATADSGVDVAFSNGVSGTPYDSGVQMEEIDISRC